MVAVTAQTSSVAENMKKIMKWRETNIPKNVLLAAVYCDPQ